MSLPMIKRTLFTDRGQEIHQANPSPMMKSALTEENIETDDAEMFTSEVHDPYARTTGA